MMVKQGLRCPRACVRFALLGGLTLGALFPVGAVADGVVSAQSSRHATDIPSAPNVLTDRLLIQLRPGVRASELFTAAGREPLAAIGRRWGVTAIRPAFDPAPQNTALATWLGMDRSFVLDVPPGTDVRAMAAEFAAHTDCFESVELEHTGVFDSPSDPLYAQQWYLDNFGQTACTRPGVPDADIDWSDAIAAIGSISPVTVAVVDTGVSTSHPELLGRLVPGRNVVPNAPDPNNTDDVSVPSHGTMCAGLIASNAGNSIGIVGIAPSARIMPIKFANSTTGLPPSGTTLANALTWAADHGARICSVSFGLPTVGPSAGVSLRNSVLYCQGQGLLVVTSTGNDPGAVNPQYPAAYPETIAVGAMTNQDVAWSSQSAPAGVMDLTAPGQCVLTTVDEPSIPNGYDFRDGTSLSTPIVSGVAALVWSVNPALTAVQVRDIIQNSADDMGPQGVDSTYGYGRVNAAEAVLAAIATLPRCLIDLNGSGGSDTGDLFMFLDLYYREAGQHGSQLQADFNNDDFVDVGDLFAFMTQWFAGC